MSESSDCDRIEERLLTIGPRIGDGPASLHHPAQATMPEWSGADVVITSDFNYEPGNHFYAHDLLVRTHHAVALTWLFLEARDAFGTWLDASNKYGFYGSLGRAAIQHLAAHQPEADDPRPLLGAVLGRVFEWLAVLKVQGAIPPNSPWVLHTQDAEGRQHRTDARTGADTD